MLDNLTSHLSGVIKTLRGHARLTEQNIQDALRDVRIALLEADVALSVVKDFMTRVRERAIGKEVMLSLTPSQAFIQVVQNELTQLMGGGKTELNLSCVPPAIVLITGLQGSGKTTSAAKLARLLQAEKKKVLLASADVYRPAAIEQLQQLATQLNVDCFTSDPQQKPEKIAKQVLHHAQHHFYDVVIFDTAGRLAIDADMMSELKRMHSILQPVETLFVVDAMQGQDAVNTAAAFHATLALTGVVLTKLDGDARGGAALSVRHVTGCPIKYVGISEKIDGLEVFHPERMASRILGMGDVLSLIETVKNTASQQEAKKIADKIKSGKKFDLTDFQKQLQQIRGMGGMGAMLDKMPSHLSAMASGKNMAMGDEMMRHSEGIINAMTREERCNPELIKASRKRRIAAGAGVHVQKVNQLLKQFEEAQKMMKMFSGGRNIGKLMSTMRGRFPGMR